MKTRFLQAISLSVILFACEVKDDTSPLWGVDFSDENSAGFAIGSVDLFNADTKTVYIVKTANLRCAEDNVYKLSYTFESGDEMEIKIVKKTVDYNYSFPGIEGENQLLSASFNGELLNLGESKVAIQPRADENKVATLTRLQTLDRGVFNGTIGRVPLLK
jgi:hypothetical protein